MLDHVGAAVTDYEASKRFFEQALRPLGYQLMMEFGTIAGFGARGAPDFWIAQSETSAPVHVAFSSPDRRTVDAFYQAALKAGGRDNGAPGLRPQYHPTYYGAFIYDPDGNNIEAVCHAAEE